MNITSLAFEVTAPPWQLLADASVVGDAQRPASWLGSSRSGLHDTCPAMSAMMDSYSSVWLCVADKQDTLPAHNAQLQVERDQAGVRRVRQLPSLPPAIPWGRLRTAATSIAGAGDQNLAVSLLRSIESVWF
jgi:hypothetical protein